MNKVNFKDVAHLYLGCMVQVRKKDRNKEWLTGLSVEVTKKSNHGDWITVNFDEVHCIINEQWNEVCSNFQTYFLCQDEIKPLLRKLDSMTEDEHEEWKDIRFDMDCKLKPLYTDADYNSFMWLLSKDFDLFGLIESGEAIDKSSLSSPSVAEGEK